MAQMMQIPIVGLVENMSHVICPHCGEKIAVFGNGKTEAVAQSTGIPYLGSLPIDPELTRLCDEGAIERVHKSYLSDCMAALERISPRNAAGSQISATTEPAAKPQAVQPESEIGQKMTEQEQSGKTGKARQRS